MTHLGDVVCNAGWTAVEENCYYVVSGLKNWTAAETACQVQGGHLATFIEDSQRTAVMSMLTDAGLSSAYISLNDRDVCIL